MDNESTLGREEESDQSVERDREVHVDDVDAVGGADTVAFDTVGGAEQNDAETVGGVDDFVADTMGGVDTENMDTVGGVDPVGDSEDLRDSETNGQSERDLKGGQY